MIPTTALLARNLGYNYTSSAIRTRHNPAVGSHMPETRLSNPRKRQRTEQYLPSPPLSKRQKKLLHHSPGYINTPAFWDSLSKIWLTKHSLREFNRRNSCPRSPCCQARRPTARNFLAEQRNVCQSISAADFIRNSVPKRLQDIKRFARHGGPDLSDLVGCPEPIPLNRKMSLSRSSSHRSRGSSTSRSRTTERTTAKTTSRKSKSSNPNDANYQQKLIDGGVFPYGYEYPDGSVPPLPPNWDETNRKLAQPRPSLSPSRFPEKKFQEFVRKDARAFNEDAVKDTVLPAMLEAMDTSRGAEKNILFTNINPITDDIAQAKPDYYYGARPEQIHPHIRSELSNHIIPSSHTHLPAVPNFFLEAKGPDGSLAVVQRQVCHAGAIGARAIQSLRSYRQDEPAYNNNAYTISSTYHGGTLKMYGHSVAQPKGLGTRPEYYMHQLRSFAMTDSTDTFLDGATAFKNAMDLVEEYRNAAIVRANERVAQTNEDENRDEGGGEDEEEVEEEVEEEQESPNNTPPTTTDIHEPESSDEDTTHLKRPNRHSLLSSPPQRKRHNPGYSQQPELGSSEPSGLSQQFED